MPPATAPDSTPHPVPPRWHGRDRPVVALLTAWLLVVFLGVLNPWWMPSGDAEVFLVAARNLLHGEGLTFNGHRLAFVPPGWPIVLAGWLRVTDEYLWLKAVQIGHMLIFLLGSYAILRRFTSPATAGLACASAGVLWPLYPLTMWLHSDALFCAIAAMTGLAAVRWGDCRLGWAWLVAIIVGCALGVAVRWAALVQAFVLAGLVCGSGAGMSGERSTWWPHLVRRHWVGALAVFIATLGTFFAIKNALGPDLERARPAAAAPADWPFLPLASIHVPEEVLPPDLLIGGEDPAVSPARELAHRVLSMPQWYSWTLFSPLRVAGGFRVKGVPVGLLLDRGVGLLAMAMLTVAAWQGARLRQYLYLGVLVYVAALSLNWPHVNNRYLVPVAPFLIAGILDGLSHLATRRAFRLVRWAFVAAVLAINGLLWSIDVAICRSPTAEDFYARWEAGIYQPLVEIGSYLDEQPGLSDGQIVASQRYQNLNERWEYKLSPRSLVLMTGHRVDPVPTALAGWGVRKAQGWARENGVRFYVQQNPTMPGRVWHFRVTDGIEEAITGYPPPKSRPQFELYEMLPDPIPRNPDLRSLQYRPVPALRGEALERATRRVPHLRDPQ